MHVYKGQNPIHPSNEIEFAQTREKKVIFIDLMLFKTVWTCSSSPFYFLGHSGYQKRSTETAHTHAKPNELCKQIFNEEPKIDAINIIPCHCSVLSRQKE